MSASREKKERQGPSGMSQRELRESMKKKTEQKKRTAYSIFGVFAACAVLLLVLWNMGLFEEKVIGATIGPHKVWESDINFYYSTFLNYEYSAAEEGASNFDIERPASEQIYTEADEEAGTERETYAEFFRRLALEDIRKIIALRDAAKKEGYRLSAEGKEAVQDTLRQIDTVCTQYGITRKSYFDQMFGAGMTERDFVRNLTEQVLAEEYSNYHIENMTFSAEEYSEYYNDHRDDLDRYDFHYFIANGRPLTWDEDGTPKRPTEEELPQTMAAAKVKADQMAARLKKGEDFVALSQEYALDSVREYYDDPEYTLNTNVRGSNVSYTYADFIKDPDRKAGDVAVREEYGGHTVVLFLARRADEFPTADIRHILFMADTETDENDEPIPPTEEALAAAKAEAERVLALWKEGRATPETFGKLAEEYSADPGSNLKGGLYENVQKGMMFGAFDAWIFEEGRKPGDTGLIENPQEKQWGWHIIYYENPNDPVWKAEASGSLKAEEGKAWREALFADYEIVDLMPIGISPDIADGTFENPENLEDSDNTDHPESLEHLEDPENADPTSAE